MFAAKSSLLIAALAFVGCSGSKLSDAGQFVGSFFGFSGAAASQGSKLSLIGAGFARTGTKSTQEALEHLGNYKIYDTRSK